MASRLVVCRLSFSQVVPKHSVALFSKGAIHADLAGRFCRLAQVPVSEDDGHSKYLCKICKNRFTSLVAKLQSFSSMAKPVGSPRQLTPSCRKRVRDTSGVGVSPHTAQGRQRSKRPAASKVLFPELELEQENVIDKQCEHKNESTKQNKLRM